MTDQERQKLLVEAGQTGSTIEQHIRTRCGFMVRITSLPGTDEREDEADDAWERLKRLGPNAQDFFEY